MAFQIPSFLVTPIAIITDEVDPERAEIITFRTSIEAWRTSVIAAMTILNPNWGWAPASLRDQHINCRYRHTGG
jgi:hypothetical protein